MPGWYNHCLQKNNKFLRNGSFMETIKFGPDQKFKLTEPLDTWLSVGLRDFAVPEAVGSSARVFRLDYPPLTGDYADYPAIKIMRPDKTEYALPLFNNEVSILDTLKDVPGITPMIGLGYLQTSKSAWPDEIAPLSSSKQKQSSADNLAGTVDLFGKGETQQFLSELDQRTAEGWLAFIILPRRWEDSLYLRCDAGYTRGDYNRTFPVSDALQAALQICEILQTAHNNKIVYLDHKALHYYWNQPRKQVYVLDWNIGRWINNGNTTEAYQFDVLQFSARALHHFMTGRQAPGSVKVGPNNPEEIRNAPHKYQAIWTYDDQKRLTEYEMDVLELAIQGHYQTPSELAEVLQSLYNQRQSQA
jgi:serine/threonine protein kinase